ncbi:MAG TPA: matrixin family metalloprotease [Thermoanaerobaculia bacterium]|nr:matrixin family metalloprotease [Thermoanaerobaculia bacterium]
MPRLAAVLLTLALTASSFAATRMTYDINGAPTPIEWAPTAFPLRYEIDQRLAQVHPNATAMVERAFAAWAAVPSTNVRFEGAGIVSKLATGPERIAVSLADDLLSDSGAAAITTYTYDTKTGRMTDADIYVDKNIFAGNFNAQLAIQHEVGHVLGLDHSAVLSSVMYPYLGSDETPADFDYDDRIAIATMYPKGDPTLDGATLSGRVLGDGGGIFAAQVVVVNEQGQPLGTVLTDPAGEFAISGIPAGRYRLYAEPLDGPVNVEALQGTWRAAKLNSFSTEFFSEDFVEVENGKVYGNLVLTTAGAVQLNPKWIGVAEAGRPDFSLSTAPATVRPGQTINVIVGGDGFTSSMTTFEILNPAFRRITDFVWADNYVRATYVVEAAAPASSAVILVKSGRESAALTGALRVYRPSGSRNRAVRH